MGVAAAAAGGYYYFKPDERAALEKKAAHENEVLKSKASDAAGKVGDAKDAAKARIDTLYKQGDISYDDAKVCS